MIPKKLVCRVKQVNKTEYENLFCIFGIYSIENSINEITFNSSTLKLRQVEWKLQIKKLPQLRKNSCHAGLRWFLPFSKELM